MKIFAISNQKGGVAKTTTALALGRGLAKSGYRTLLVDLDPQGSLTSFLNVDTDNKPTILEFLGIQRKGKKLFAEVKVGIDRNIDLLPADISLEAAAKLLTGEPGAALFLHNALKEVRSDYDYCIIDTSPSLSVLTVNAFVAANSVIVPVKPEEASIKGVELLISTIEDVKDINPNLIIAGFLITMYDRRRKAAKAVLDKVYAISDKTKIPVYSSFIRSSASGASSGENPFAEKNSPVSADYGAFLEELLQIENKHPIKITNNSAVRLAPKGGGNVM